MNPVDQKKTYLFLKQISKEFPNFFYKILSSENDYEYILDKELNVNDCYIPNSGKIFSCKTYSDIVVNFLRSERIASFSGITFSENSEVMRNFFTSLEEEGINIFRKNSFNEPIDEDVIILSTKNILSYSELENLKEALKNHKKSLFFIVENLTFNEPMQKFLKFLEISLKKMKNVEQNSFEGKNFLTDKLFRLKSQIKVEAPLWNEIVPGFIYSREEISRFFVVASEGFLSDAVYADNISNIHKIFSWLIQEDVFFKSFFSYSKIEKKSFQYTRFYIIFAHFYWIFIFLGMSFFLIRYRPFFKD
jgi:hypothetical protein